MMKLTALATARQADLLAEAVADRLCPAGSTSTRMRTVLSVVALTLFVVTVVVVVAFVLSAHSVSAGYMRH